MKKLLIISALTLSCGAFIPATSFAQASKMDSKSMKDGSVMMKDGKMMMMKGGAWVPMTSDMTMPNGTKVMADGNVMMKEGKKMMLKNGQSIKADGTMGMGKM